MLHYLEEALAETVAQLSINGIKWRNYLAGVKFPFGNDGSVVYVTRNAIKIEANGVLLGPINVSGMIYNVYYAYREK